MVLRSCNSLPLFGLCERLIAHAQIDGGGVLTQCFVVTGLGFGQTPTPVFLIRLAGSVGLIRTHLPTL